MCHLYLNMTSRKDSTAGKQEDLIQIKKEQGQEIKCRGKRGPRGSFFPCYLKSLLCFVLPSSSFFYFTLPTSSSFLPINPPANLFPLFYLPIPSFISPPSSLVPSPSVTLTSTAGDTPAVFGPPASLVYCSTTLFIPHSLRVRLIPHYGLYMSTQALARAHFFLSLWTGSRAFLCVFLLSQATQLETAHL